MERNRRNIKETIRSKEGLMLRMEKYCNRDKVIVRIVETGETKTVSYKEFKKGRVYADYLHYPYWNGDCSFNQAKFYTVSIFLLLTGALGALIYEILK